MFNQSVQLSLSEIPMVTGHNTEQSLIQVIRLGGSLSTCSWVSSGSHSSLSVAMTLLSLFQLSLGISLERLTTVKRDIPMSGKDSIGFTDIISADLLLAHLSCLLFG